MGSNTTITTSHINEVLNKEVADTVTINSAEEIYKKINIDDQTAYIISDSFSGNPFLLLGQVIEIRKSNGVCPSNFNDVSASFNFSPFPVTGIKIDEETRLKKPELRSSIIVNKETSAKIGFLNYLNGQLDSKSSFSLMVFDQAKGLVNFQDETWTSGVRRWIQENHDIYNDPEICYLYVISGFVQKNIVRKKYVKFEAGAKGGAYGININGELATSTEDYSLDIILGLTPAIIKRPSSRPYPVQPETKTKSFDPLNRRSLNFTRHEPGFDLENPVPTDLEKKQFSSATGKTFTLSI